MYRTTPYGYCVKGGRIAIDPVESEKLIALFTLYDSGLSVKVATTESGIPRSTFAVREMLRNDFYIGNSTYPQLIDPDLFRRVSTRLDQKGAHLVGKAGKKVKEPLNIQSSFKVINTSIVPRTPAEIYRMIAPASAAGAV